MRTWVYRPTGPGPFPLAIINHGSSSNPQLRLQQASPRFEAVTAWFIRHGYVVAIPQRPGHGETGGPYLEGYGSCENPDYHRAGVAIAEAINSVIKTMMQQPFVRKAGVVIIGHSAGGWGSLALAGLNPPPRLITAVINFSGGLGGRSYDWPNLNCNPDRLVDTVRQFGKTARIPSLWIYAENDSYFGPKLSRRMAKAYSDAGGLVEYHLLPPIGDDGHFLIYLYREVHPLRQIVEQILERFLDRATSLQRR